MIFQDGGRTSSRILSSSQGRAIALQLVIWCSIAWSSSPPVMADQIVGPGGHATIQAGINAASPGATVSVAPGTYVENIVLSGKDIHLLSTHGASNTIIDGGGSGNVVHISSSAVTANTLIGGFTIRNGHAAAGGGLMIRDGASPTIQHNIIELNHAEVSGGGLKVSHGADPAVLDNQIHSNFAGQSGGGIHVEGLAGPLTRALIVGNTIRDNEVGFHPVSTGGGVKVNFSTVPTVIHGNRILGNIVTFAGGGISVFAADAQVTNNAISGNDGGEFAGGVHFETNANEGPRSLLLEGNTITKNRATDLGGGVASNPFFTDSTVIIRNNDISFNTCMDPACAQDVNCPLGCGKGGGIVAQRGTNVLIQGNHIEGNRADCYGAARFDNVPEAVELVGNTVKGNSAAANHPGVGCLNVGGCRVARNRFLGNFPESPDSGGVHVGALDLRNSGTTVVENNHFHGNVGNRSGAMTLRVMSETPLVRNNTFVDNESRDADAGGTIRIIKSPENLVLDAQLFNNAFIGDLRAITYLTSTDNRPELVARNNSFFGQTTAITSQHTTVAQLNAEIWASGNIAADPGLLEPAVSPRIPDESPVAGQALGDQAPEEDFFGLPRPSASGFAIGAAEPCAFPETLELTGKTFDSEKVREACMEIFVGPGLQIVAPGDVTLRAARRVILRSGTSVGSGATLKVVIDPMLAFDFD